MLQRRSAVLSVIAIGVLCGSCLADAPPPDRVHIGHDLVVQAGEKVGDAVCVGCSIFVRGETAGDAVAVGGSVTVEAGASIGGGVTTVLGDVRMQNRTQVAADVVAVAGTLRRDGQTKIGGDVTALAGSFWTILIIGVPLMLVGGFITLLIWLVQRSRNVVPAPA